MPQLPDPYGIKRNIAESRRPSAHINTSQVGTGLQSVGKALGSFVERKEESRDRFEISKAKAAWVRSKVDHEEVSKEDQEYKGLPERHTKALNKSRDDILSTITNPKRRAELEAYIEEDSVYSISRVRGYAKARETDVERALLTADIEGLRNAALTGDDTGKVINDINERILATKGAGYINAEQAQALGQKTFFDYAKGRIEMAKAGPERQELLDGELGKYIPADIRAKMTENNRLAYLDDEAQRTVDVWDGAGYDYARMVSEAKKIKDPDLRKEVLSQADAVSARAVRAKSIAEDNLFQDIYDAIDSSDSNNAGKVYSAYMDGGARDGLTASQQNSLKGLADAKVSGKDRKTDIGVWVEYTQLSFEDRDKAREYFWKNSKSFSDSDIRTIVTSLQKESPQPKALRGALAEFNVRMDELKIKKTDERKAKAFKEFNDWYMDAHVNGKEPSDKEVAFKLDHMTEKVLDNWWARDVYAFNATPDEMEEVIQDAPAEDTEEVLSGFKQKFGRDPSKEELFYYYTLAKSQGRFD